MIYYLTTRGLNDKGVIRSLDATPTWFHRKIVVVSGKENKSAIMEKYPNLQNYWASPSSVNTAAAKRKFIFTNSEVDNFVLMNDELVLSVVDFDTKKTYTPLSNPKLFKKNLAEFESLVGKYAGFSAMPRLFSNTVIEKGLRVVEHKFVGAFFHYNRKFAVEHLDLARLNYHEDVYYSLKAMSIGALIAQYAGFLYQATTHRPRRHFIDRTTEVQERDTKILMEAFPKVVTLKKDYDPVEMDSNINVKWRATYDNSIRPLFVSDDNAALEAHLLCKKVLPRSMGLVSSAATRKGLGEPRGKALSSLQELAPKVKRFPELAVVTDLHIERASVVFCSSEAALKELTAKFRSHAKKFVLLSSLSNKSTSSALAKWKRSGFLNAKELPRWLKSNKG